MCDAATVEVSVDSKERLLKRRQKGGEKTQHTEAKIDSSRVDFIRHSAVMTTVTVSFEPIRMRSCCTSMWFTPTRSQLTYSEPNDDVT
mmetsp:Transcript_41351/g.48020  ORF Transcript_41351/g.48020 Transcript_41351/m.48020 type:complete len:88 (+) Transcript_41351:3-266(+)